MPRVTRLFALSATVILTSCTDAPVPTAPRGPSPSFTTYAVTVSAPTILEGFAEKIFDLALGINNVGDAVGQSLQTGGVRATLWPSGSTIATDFAGQDTEGHDINLAGQVGGWHNPDAILWTPAGATYTVANIGAQLLSPFRSVVNAINDYGQVVGVYDVSALGEDTKCFLWTPSSPNGTTGTVTTLPDLGAGSRCFASDINSTGHVVGSRTTASGDSHAFLWSPTTPNATVGTIRDLDPTNQAFAAAINDALQIGGSRTIAGVTNAAIWTPTGTGAFTVLDLGTFTGTTSSVSDINNAGFVVGTVRTTPTDGDAFIWQNGVFTPLPELPNLDRSSALAMTDIMGTLVRVVGNTAPAGSLTFSAALRWDVTVEPITPAGCLAQLIQAVQNLETTGVLGRGETRSLLGKLDALARHLSHGHVTPAQNLARAVIAEVEALLRSGRVSTSEAQPLIDSADCVIDGL